MLSVPDGQGVVFSADSRTLLVQYYVEQQIAVYAVNDGRLEDTGERLPIAGRQMRLDVIALQNAAGQAEVVGIGHSGPAADDVQRIADHVAQDEAGAGGRRGQASQPAALDPVHALAHGVQLIDGAATGQ